MIGGIDTLLLRINFITKDNKQESFIVSGNSLDNCKEIAKKYIEFLGGTTVAAKINRINHIDY